MEKIFKCDYCGVNALVTNPKGGCVACGAPIKRENIEMLEEKKENAVMGYSYNEQGVKTGAWGVCSASTIGGNYDFGQASASYVPRSHWG